MLDLILGCFIGSPELLEVAVMLAVLFCLMSPPP